MKNLFWLIFVLSAVWGASWAGAAKKTIQVEFAAPMISVESPVNNTSFEKRDGQWTLTTQFSDSKSVALSKISDPSEVVKANNAYNQTRDWALESLKSLRPVATCKDIKIRIKGAVSTSTDLCSKVPAHRIFSAHLTNRLLTVIR